MTMILDRAIYVEANGLNKTLDQVIVDGDLGGSGSTPDATDLVKGKLKLAGDLGGTADLPTVPELANKAPLASPIFTGTPTAPTPGVLDNSTKIATTSYVDTSTSNAKQKIAYIRDEKAAATQGGTATAASLFVQRVLNVLSGDTSFITLTANRFTLQAGTYEIDAVVPAYLCNNHKSLLRSVTASSNILIGSAAYSNTTSGSVSESLIRGQFTIASATQYEIQTRVSLDRATVGYGIANNMGVPEVYTQVKITKLA